MLTLKIADDEAGNRDEMKQALRLLTPWAGSECWFGFHLFLSTEGEAGDEE